MSSKHFVKALSAYERETVVTACDADDHVSVHTCQRPVISSLRAKSQTNPAVTEVASGVYGTTPWAEFYIPVKRVSWAGLVKRAGNRSTVVPLPAETGWASGQTERGSHLSPIERQTLVVANDDDGSLWIETTQRSVYNALHRKAFQSDRITEGSRGFWIAPEDASWGGFVKRLGSSSSNLPKRPKTGGARDELNLKRDGEAA